jgi:hypothetical protein
MAANANLRGLAQTISRRPEWILALAATLVAVGLHFFFLSHVGGLWRDEVNLVNLSGRHSLAEMSQDSFPVLMPLLVGGWTGIGFGQSDSSLRLLGMLIGLALPAALWLAVWKIHRRPPLLGLVLLALNSTVILFGDSLRAFGLGSLTILLTTAGAGWFLKKPTWRRAGVLTALAILGVQALFQNAVFIAAICLGAWAVCLRRKDLRMATKILAVAALSASSLLPYWSRLVSLPSSAAALRVGFHPRYVFTNFDNAAGFPMLQYTWVWGMFALALVVCGFVPLVARSKTNSPDASALFTHATALLVAAVTVAGFFWFAASPSTRWWFFPLMAAAMVVCDVRAARRSPTRRESVGGQASACSEDTLKRELQPAGPEAGAPADNDFPLFAGVTLLAACAGFTGFLWFAALLSEPWYFLPLLALAAVVFELGLPASRHWRAAIFGFAGMTLVLAVPAARSDLNWRFTNVDLIAQRLSAEARTGDYIVVSPWYVGITFDRYYKGPAPWNTLPPLADHSTHRYDLVREEMGKRDAIQPVLDHMSAALQSGHRVWVVGTMAIPKAGAPIPADLPPVAPNYAGSELRHTGNWTVQVAQFLSNHSGRFAPVELKTAQNVAPENLKLYAAEDWQGAANVEAPANVKTNSP